MDELVDIGRDNSEDAEVCAIRHVDGLEPWIGGYKPCGTILPLAKLLHQELSVQYSDDDGAVSRVKAFVHDQDVARLDACAYHRISLHTDKKVAVGRWTRTLFKSIGSSM